ncbi:MAG: hypothetical protein JKY81_01670 [Colwellia sp.]|nr:hypothetical protein [Colwellia sp.]
MSIVEGAMFSILYIILGAAILNDVYTLSPETKDKAVRACIMFGVFWFFILPAAALYALISGP